MKLLTVCVLLGSLVSSFSAFSREVNFNFIEFNSLQSSNSSFGYDDVNDMSLIVDIFDVGYVGFFNSVSSFDLSTSSSSARFNSSTSMFLLGVHAKVVPHTFLFSEFGYGRNSFKRDLRSWTGQYKDTVRAVAKRFKFGFISLPLSRLEIAGSISRNYIDTLDTPEYFTRSGYWQDNSNLGVTFYFDKKQRYGLGYQYRRTYPDNISMFGTGLFSDEHFVLLKSTF